MLPFKLHIENEKHPYFEWRGEGGGFFCFLKSSYLSTTHNFVKDCGSKNFNHNLILTCNIYIFIHLIKHKETPGCPSPAPSFMIAFCILDKKIPLGISHASPAWLKGERNDCYTGYIYLRYSISWQVKDKIREPSVEKTCHFVVCFKAWMLGEIVTFAMHLMQLVGQKCL